MSVCTSVGLSSGGGVQLQTRATSVGLSDTCVPVKPLAGNTSSCWWSDARAQVWAPRVKLVLICINKMEKSPLAWLVAINNISGFVGSNL